MSAREQSPICPEGLRQGLSAAANQAEGAPETTVISCQDNWVEAGAIDEVSDAPLANIAYRIYNIESGEAVAQGRLGENGEGRRHQIPLNATQLYVIFGDAAAIDQAEDQLEELRRKHELQQNARPNWRGIPAGLDEAGFNAAFDRKAHETGRLEKVNAGFLEGSGYGFNIIYDFVATGFDGDETMRRLYEDDRRRCFDEYRLVTGAREASEGESFAGGAGQGVSFGFGDEAMSGLQSLFDARSYEEILEERRQILRQEQIANPGFFVGGEIAGAVPTIFIPVGGAAANAARAGQGVRGAMIAGARSGSIYGAISGFGHDEGGFVDRLDGAALGGVTGGLAAAVLSGAGVLVARGVSRTRIWARIRGRPRPGSLSDEATRKWYLEQERLIPKKIDTSASLEGQGRQAHALRNEARAAARELMANRKLAEQLARENPNLTWEQIVARTEAKGIEGDDVFREIIASSQRSRSSVNKKLGLE